VKSSPSAVLLLVLLATPAFATVTVSSPAPGTTVTSPVHYIASATTSTCSKGVASMGVYVDNNLVYVVDGTQMNTTISMASGYEHTVVEEWDNCGGATYTTINLTVTGGTTSGSGVTVTSPTPGSTVTSPVHYVATASTNTCSKGVASMGIYVNNTLTYVVNGTSLNYELTLAPGAQHTVVEEWDYCGGAMYTTVNLNVISGAPTVSISAKSTTIAQGGSTTLTVTAGNATKVAVSGTDGSTYALPASGGQISVSPPSTTTYTAEATNSVGTSSAQTTVTVSSTAPGASPIDHVIFMLQENHTFDNYFGMLNPYRKSQGWNIGSDGKEYDVDGIDDKLNTLSNKDAEGASYYPYRLRTTCVDDESDAWPQSFNDASLNDFLTTRPIKMDGFVNQAEAEAKACLNGTGFTGECSGSFTDTTGERAMGYYDQGFLNYYYYMASQFAVSDRWFSPVASNSIPNRVATFTGGTTLGLVYDPGVDHLPQMSANNIFEELQNGQVSWRVYYTVTQGGCLGGSACGTGNANLPDTSFLKLTYANQFVYSNPSHAACTGTTKPSSVVGDPSNSLCIDPNHIAPLSQYYTDVKNNTLPAFAFIESGSGLNDEHPGSGNSNLNGQSEVAKIVNALMTSPSWASSVFFLSYDEGGGVYDHVPPVAGHSNDYTDSSLGTIPDISSISIAPDGYKPCVPSGSPTTHCDLKATDPGAHSGDAATQSGFAAQLGFRVPNLVISPFTRKHYVSHAPMDHTAVIKFVENRFLGSSVHLTARDAAQPNLLDFFDFTNKPWATPPAPPAPVTPSSLGYDPCSPDAMGP
jgi:phospholipase C